MAWQEEVSVVIGHPTSSPYKQGNDAHSQALTFLGFPVNEWQSHHPGPHLPSPESMLSQVSCDLHSWLTCNISLA